MKTTDTSEKGLESLIVASFLSEGGYVVGASADFDREHAIDVVKLFEFLNRTQPDIVDLLGIGQDGPKCQQFLHRLQGAITKDGVIHVLRHGIQHGPASNITLFYATPTPGNRQAEELHAANIFSVTRQLHYSPTDTALSLDLALFINGLPVVTFELKNNLTKQNVEDAVRQYMRDRDPRELLFQFPRCAVHFAVDNAEVRMCTHLKGKNSWFLPFNKGYDDGAGNPPNPNGIATDYLWKEILSRRGLVDILENYAQVVEEKDEETGKIRKRQIFPRYHQLKVVRDILGAIPQDGVGKRYLIQHSAGSGKSNSIAWLAHQLIDVKQNNRPLFDSVVIVTDRTILDRQIRNTIKQFAQVASTIGHADSSSDLRKYIRDGKKIIITTVQKFPVIFDAIGDEHRGNNFAIIIDEAHSSQGGRSSAKMNIALNPNAAEPDYEDAGDDEETVEDRINDIIEKKRMLTNASYFAFTATPKNRTLEVFGAPVRQPDGKVRHVPFHSYTMKQAIQEGFIKDVLKNYTPVESYYRLVKTIPDDPLFDVNKAQKKLRSYVESHKHAIGIKTEIMIEHFQERVYRSRKLGGHARAMVITRSIERAIKYYHAFNEYLEKKKHPYKAIVAFSGEHEYGGKKVTESTLNGFPSSQIPKKIRTEPYRFLIVADKFQTGYDEPLLHTMYVDKPLSSIKAVQTLSRLNRAHPDKNDTFVLDFYNDSDTIAAAFEPYYRTTILSDETDPNKLHDLKADLDRRQVYSPEQVNELVSLYLSGADRDRLDPILRVCSETYKRELDENAQVDFKGKAKAFLRTYSFLSSILPYGNTEWEKLAIFLNYLVLILPTPIEDDLSQGILEAINMDSYRAEVKEAINISLTDCDAVIDPVPTAGGGHTTEPQLEALSSIITSFNSLFGNIQWKDGDYVQRVIAEEIPNRVAADESYQNAMRYNDKDTARIEHDAALKRVMLALLANNTNMYTDQTELYKQFSDNPSFKKWLADICFLTTYKSEEQNGRDRHL